MPFGVDDALMLSSILSGVGALAGGNSGYVPSSFDNTAADPTARMAQTYKLLEQLGGAMAKQQSEGYSVPSAVVQTPQGFSGHGLPMPINLGNLHDPAIDHPEYLHKAGLDLPADMFAPPAATTMQNGPFAGAPIDPTTGLPKPPSVFGRQTLDDYAKQLEINRRGTSPATTQPGSTSQALTALRAIR